MAVPDVRTGRERTAKKGAVALSGDREGRESKEHAQAIAKAKVTAPPVAPGAEREPEDRDVALPPLREELRLLPAARDRGRGRGWLLHDPVRQRYFRIGVRMARLLSCWPAGSLKGLMAEMQRRFGEAPDPAEVEAAAAFLQRHDLVEPAPGQWRKLAERARKEKGTPGRRLLHGYLFFRVPLVRPRRFLERLLPVVSWLGSRGGLALVLLVSLAGFYLTWRQWAAFSQSFSLSLTPEGLLLHGIVLVLVKTAHELGHALVATRLGCRVPVMGVAFLVMVPMLYTDVRDVWRLASHRQRLLVSAAGILVELGIAGVALFLWAFLPEGAARSAAYFVAVTSLAGSLAINASPFMRFDGYHILSDLLRMDNLQPRAFALALWRLRRWLFALRQPPPETLSPRLERWLVIYAWASWLWRVMIFLGIALLVFHAFPRVVGLPLAAFEVWWFLLRPVGGELREWWRMRRQILAAGGWLRPLGIALLAGVVLAAPLWKRVNAPAVLMAAHQTEVRAPEAARVAQMELREGRRVRRGDVLLRLESPDLDHALRQAGIRLQLIELKLGRLAADARLRAQRLVLLREKAAIEEELKGLLAQKARLVLTAPHDGVIRDVPEGLRPGLWVGRGDLLARVVDGPARRATALVPEEDVARLSSGARARFIADDPAAPRLEMELVAIDAARREGRDIAYLASVHGGPVEAERDEKGEIRLRQGLFPVRLRAVAGHERSGRPPCRQVCTGRVLIEARPESLLAAMSRRVLAVIFREAGP
jgi:putative peptide zinc metalloprotease protein